MSELLCLDFCRATQSQTYYSRSGPLSS